MTKFEKFMYLFAVWARIISFAGSFIYFMIRFLTEGKDIFVAFFFSVIIAFVVSTLVFMVEVIIFRICTKEGREAEEKAREAALRKKLMKEVRRPAKDPRSYDFTQIHYK